MIIGTDGKQLKSKKTKLEQDREKLQKIAMRYGVRPKFADEFIQEFFKELAILTEENKEMTYEELNAVIEDVK